MPNPDGFTDLLKAICAERCVQCGDPPCWRLPDLADPCEQITPCRDCLRELEMIADAIERHG
jgi:hypothetical protein